MIFEISNNHDTTIHEKEARVLRGGGGIEKFKKANTTLKTCFSDSLLLITQNEEEEDKKEEDKEDKEEDGEDEKKKRIIIE